MVFLCISAESGIISKRNGFKR